MAGKGGKKQKQAAPKKLAAFDTAVRAAGLTALSGKDAVEGSYRAQIVAATGWQCSGSVDMDAHFKATEGQSPRWDYGIGISHANGQDLVCWVEPHPASSTGEVTKMLEKLAWLKGKLDTVAFKKLKAMTYVSGRVGHPFYWLRTVNGQCRITAHGKEAKLLAKSGLRMPSQHLIMP
jgi:hypothetical protein